jgi:hypothetical protein
VPDRNRGLTVDFQNVRDVILEINRHGRIGMARFDRWQATMILQELREAGIAAEAKTFSNPEQLGMYRTYKTLLYNNLLYLQPDQPECPWYARSRRQLKELQLINGMKIDHPEFSAGGGPGAKDLSDAQALAFELAANPAFAPSVIDLGNRDQGAYMLEEQARQVRPPAGSLVQQALAGGNRRL